MARYLGPKEKIERRIGERLGLKGDRSKSPKAAVARRPYPPGFHGPSAKHKKLSEFGQQLRSKQKVRNIYRLLEKTFKSSVKSALESGKEPYEAIIHSLESRLDNIVFRAGIGQSRDQAHQMVSHGHILVNKKKVNVSSYKVKAGDIITIRDGSKKMPLFATIVPNWLKDYKTPEWIELDKGAISAKVKGLPGMTDNVIDTQDLQAIIEYYSR